MPRPQPCRNSSIAGKPRAGHTRPLQSIYRVSVRIGGFFQWLKSQSWASARSAPVCWRSAAAMRPPSPAAPVSPSRPNISWMCGTFPVLRMPRFLRNPSTRSSMTPKSRSSSRPLAAQNLPTRMCAGASRAGAASAPPTRKWSRPTAQSCWPLPKSTARPSCLRPASAAARRLSLRCTSAWPPTISAASAASSTARRTSC